MHRFVMEINDMIVKDDMTGLYNRRYVDERLPADIVKATIEKTPLTLVFLDIDNLKKMNDIYGHAVGDEAIEEVANTLQRCIRMDIDWVARYGGDEFLICLNNTTNDRGYQVAERIRRKIAEQELTSQKIATTVSLGIYTMEDSLLAPEELLKLADKCMYEAKQAGKNRTAKGKGHGCRRNQNTAE